MLAYGGPRNSPTKRFGGLTHRTWPSVVTTWLLDGTFTSQPDQPYLDFWRHVLERSMTACICLAVAVFFRFCLSGAAVCMMARATHLNEAFPSDSVSSSGSLLFLLYPGHHPPCGRNRRVLNPLRTRRMRSIAHSGSASGISRSRQ